MRSPDTLFWAVGDGARPRPAGVDRLVGRGWLQRISQWRNLRLLLFPLLVCALTLSGGLFGSGPASLVSAFLTALVATFGEEISSAVCCGACSYRQVPVRAVILTSLLSGLLVLGMRATESLAEAVRLRR